MFTRTLIACAFTMSCFMGLQANEQEKDSPSVELCEKNKDSSLLAGCCKGKCHKRRGCKKKNRSSELACRKDHKKKEQNVELACRKGDKKKKEIVAPTPLLECPDC